MPDEIIKELWRIKELIAQEHGYDLEALVASLQMKQRSAGQRVVDLRAVKSLAVQGTLGIKDHGAKTRESSPAS